MTGHIKAENCTHIALVERKFMAMDTASILFFNAAGNAMFKISCDDHRQLLAEQVDAFRTLAAVLKGGSLMNPWLILARAVKA